MDSTINLLPEKDKQLKRDGQLKQPNTFVEMTKPQERIFQERVVRVGGVLSFFKQLFKRKPPLLPKAKTVVIEPLAKQIPHPEAPVGLMTKLETMADRMKNVAPPAPAAPTPPPVTVPLSRIAPPPIPKPVSGNFFNRMFSKPSVAPPVPPLPPVTQVARPSMQPPVAPTRPAIPPPPAPPLRPSAPPRSAWSPPLPPTSTIGKAPNPGVPVQNSRIPLPKPGATDTPLNSPAASFVGGFGVNLVPDEAKPESTHAVALLHLSQLLLR